MKNTAAESASACRLHEHYHKAYLGMCGENHSGCYGSSTSFGVKGYTTITGSGRGEWQIVPIGNGNYHLIDKTHGGYLGMCGHDSSCSTSKYGVFGYKSTNFEKEKKKRGEWQIIAMGNGRYRLKDVVHNAYLGFCGYDTSCASSNYGIKGFETITTAGHGEWTLEGCNFSSAMTSSVGYLPDGECTRLARLDYRAKGAWVCSNRWPPAGYYCPGGCGKCKCTGNGHGFNSCGRLCCSHSPTPRDGSNPCYKACPDGQTSAGGGHKTGKCTPPPPPVPLYAGADDLQKAPPDPCEKWKQEQAATATIKRWLGNVAFYPDSTLAYGMGLERLDKIAETLKKYPWLKITVQAFSDVPAGGACTLLTKGRAEYIEAYLRSKGVKNTMTSPVGKCGKKRLIVITHPGTVAAPKGCSR